MDKTSPLCGPNILHDRRMSPWVRKEIDAIYRKFLWTGKEGSMHGGVAI
jgi:hypothetical protein